MASEIFKALDGHGYYKAALPVGKPVGPFLTKRAAQRHNARVRKQVKRAIAKAK